MSTIKTTRSRDELLASVMAKREQYPDSKELRKSHNALLLSFSAEKKLYALPIFGVVIALFGAWLAINDGDIWVFFGAAILGLLLGLLFFPIRYIFRWELKKKLKKIEGVLAELPDVDA